MRPDYRVCIRNGYSAFTLLEILVVISLILVLVAILLPSLSSVRRAASRVVCVSQLRQFGFAFGSYAGVSHDRVPFADEPVNIPRGRVSPVRELAESLNIDMPAILSDDSTDASSPWRCPVDPALARRCGTSYRYELWKVFALLGPQQLALVSKMVEGGQRVPLLRDALAFHSNAVDENGLLQVRGTNCLYSDGSIDQD